jgi:hypothetical protein
VFIPDEAEGVQPRNLVLGEFCLFFALIAHPDAKSLPVFFV